MKCSFFLASKPLQIVNSLNLQCEGRKVLYVLNAFSDCESLVNRLETVHHFAEVRIVDSIDDAYRWCVNNVELIENFFIPSDYGIHIGYWLRKLRMKKIWVYEEGLGNYEPDFAEKYRFTRLAHILLSRNKDIDMYYGASPFVNGVVLYDAERFRNRFPNYKKGVLEFIKPFLEHINSEVVRSIFPFEVNEKWSGEKVLLYLTTWKVNPKIKQIVSYYPQHFTICKPHPHIKNTTEIKELSIFNQIFTDNILAELLISALIEKCSELVIVHENSTAVQWFTPNDRLKFIDLSGS